MALRVPLGPGQAVDAAISRGFTAAGCLGGFVTFTNVRCDPFAYVMPAVSPDALHAAWYSETFRPVGPVTVTRACAIVGQRDGGTFIHCHGLWETSEGTRMGHMLAPETIVAREAELVGIGFRSATFEGRPDAETNFTLFEPTSSQGFRDPSSSRALPSQALPSQALLAKVRPNEDICHAIAAICAREGIARAAIHGIGSLNGVRFADGSSVASHATEVVIREGRVEGSSADEVRLAIDVVDIDGGISSGTLVPGQNPVCVTFELVIEPLDADGAGILPG